MTTARRTESEIRRDDDEQHRNTIKRGDRVSWSLGDGFPRAFGRVVRMCTKDYPASVRRMRGRHPAGPDRTGEIHHEGVWVKT